MLGLHVEFRRLMLRLIISEVWCPANEGLLMHLHTVGPLQGLPTCYLAVQAAYCTPGSANLVA